MTVRSRILITVLFLTALTLLVAGTTAYALQRDRVDDRIDAALQRTAEEFATFATTAVDPVTSEAFARPYELIYQGMQREVPATNEGMLGFVEGSPVLSQEAGLDMTADPELVRHLNEEVREGGGRISTVTTSTAEYRYAIAPVSMADAGRGALVIAFDRSAEQREVNDIFRSYALVSLLALIGLAAVAWAVSGRLLRPVRELRKTAEQISESDLSRRIDVQGNDDLSDLTRTVNAMLARLEEAFTSQRRLLDDAGHELRTPITIVRGHLELMDPADPRDASETRELALSELDRMHRLADDLVTLAKAERPDFVRLTPTGVGELTDNALDQARQLGPRRWHVEHRAEGIVRLDAQRLTQAWLQLAANAVKFSAEGSTVALGSRFLGTRLLVWVRDEGVGIPPEEQERVLERFARVGEEPAREGAGLGLAIVSAIAAGHGGTVRVSSEAGVGTVVVIDVPAQDTGAPGGSMAVSAWAPGAED